MTDDDPERGQTDSRHGAQVLRQVARLLRATDPADLTGPQLQELWDSIPHHARRGGSPTNVRHLPVRLGPGTPLWRQRLSFETLAADIERAADEMDRRLAEAGSPPADIDGRSIDHGHDSAGRNTMQVSEIRMADAILFAPNVRFISTGESQFDAMMTWRAELELARLDDDASMDVLAGYADFLILRIGEHPIADLLDSLSDGGEHLAGLFDDDDVNDALQEQFDDVPFNRVLIVTMVSVARPVRGHDLGAWLVAEVIARMAGAIDTLVLLYPYPADIETDGAAARGAAEVLAKYWRRVGLVPIVGHPEVLGQSTGYIALPQARGKLSSVKDVAISVSARHIRPEQLPDTRYTLIEDCGDVHGR